MAETNFFLDRRIALDLTQREIATPLEITPAAVSAWERDQSPPELSRAAELAAVYKVTQERIEKEIVAMNRRRQAVSK